MSEFLNVTIAKQANVYFDGQVTSRKLTFADGSVKTPLWQGSCRL